MKAAGKQAPPAEQAPAPPSIRGEGSLVNVAALVRNLRGRFADSPGGRTLNVARTGVQPPAPVRTRTILGADVALEFGKPGASSVVTTLVATTDDVTDGLITLAGPTDPLAAGTSLPLGVLVLARAQGVTAIDCYGLRHAAVRIDGLDGVSVRAMPGRLWVRVSRDAAARGVGPVAFAQAIYAACRRVNGVEAIEVFLACDDELVRVLEPVATIAAAQTGEHVRLKWNEFGDLECNSMDCRSCDEAPVCDQLRQVMKIRGKRRKKAHV